MSLLTQAYLLEKYGPRLDVEQLAEILHLTKGTLYNQLSAGSCQVKTYMEGNKRYADYRDVAQHLDDCRKLAA
jgi:hypothetical protein